MSANEFYEKCLGRKKHGADEAIRVSRNVENDVLRAYRIGRGNVPNDVVHTRPLGSFRSSKPRLQAALCVRMGLPKSAKGRAGNDPYTIFVFPKREPVKEKVRLVVLVFEADGTSYAHRSSRDAHRERVLRAAGYRVLRVTAEEVQQALPAVVTRIRQALGEKPPA